MPSIAEVTFRFDSLKIEPSSGCKCRASLPAAVTIQAVIDALVSAVKPGLRRADSKCVTGILAGAASMG